MFDTNFNTKNGKFSISDIISLCGGEVPSGFDTSIIISDIAPMSSAVSGEITFFENKKYINDFKNTKASACIVRKEFEDYAPDGLILIFSENPYYLYSKVLKLFYYQEYSTTQIHPSSNIDISAEVGDGTKVHAGVSIGENCIIGKNCEIQANVAIKNCIIGDNVIVGQGTVIGQDGFGYAFEGGKHHKVLQLGRVIIEDDVEIGGNCAIDRGSASDTIIGEGSKIDNLVMIAHNVKIGKHCVITGQVGIAGSTIIGDYCVFGGQCGIAGHMKIGNQVQLAAQTGVTKNLEDGAIMGGTPAVPLREYHKQHIAVTKLVKKIIKK